MLFALQINRRIENLKTNRLAASLVSEQLQYIRAHNKRQGNVSEQIIHLSLTKTYAPKWKTRFLSSKKIFMFRQGVRECVQNWYDGAQQKLDEENNLFQVSIKGLIRKMSLLNVSHF